MVLVPDKYKIGNYGYSYALIRYFKYLCKFKLCMKDVEIDNCRCGTCNTNGNGC